MTDYALLRRTRSTYDDIVHLKNPMDLTLSLCRGGFSAASLDMNVRNDEPPTCLFCIAGMQARLRHFAWADGS